VTRVLLTVATVFGILVLTPSPSWACSCAVTATAGQVKRAVTIAAGTVKWSATDGQTRTFSVTFDTVYKGAAANSEKLVTAASEAACGAGDLATGQRYLFFIDGEHPGTMRINLCGGTTAYDDAVADEVEAITGPPGKPVSAPAAESLSGNDSDRTAMVAVGAAALLALATSAAFFLRRR
jgi:hypothetical protein